MTARDNEYVGKLLTPKLYGKSTSAAKIILESDVAAPDAAHDLIAALRNSSPQLKR